MDRMFRELVEADYDKSESARLRHLLEAGKQTLRVQNATEALGLLIRSRSTWQDFTLALNHPRRWNQNLAVRRWETMDVDMEFRCFVHGNRMTAITQYHHLCFFPRVVGEHKERISSRLLEFYEAELKDLLAPKFTNFVLDLGITREDDRVVVIELNPFLETTDGCCFNWRRDLAVLEGRVPGTDQRACEFRVRERPLRGAKAMLEESWRRLFESVDP
jgi:hypothetical protein